MAKFALLLFSFIILISGCQNTKKSVNDSKKIELPKPIAGSEPWQNLIQHTKLLSPAKVSYLHTTIDGKYIVYSSTEASTSPQIFLFNAEGGAPTQLTFNNANNLYPKMSPDGTLVAFASDKEGDFNIYVINKDNPLAIMQVTFHSADDIAPSWSPDNKKLVYCSKRANYRWQISIVDITTHSLKILGPGVYPEWSSHKDPEQQLIVFQDGLRIMTVKPDGTEAKEVLISDKLQLKNPMPRWSPDSKWIVFSAKKPDDPKSQECLWIIKPDGTSLTKLTKGISQEMQPTWGGERIFFIKKDNNNIYSIKLFPLELLEE